MENVREKNVRKRETQLSNIDTSELSSLFRHLYHNRFFGSCNGFYASDSRIFAIFLQTHSEHRTLLPDTLSI